MLAEKPVQYLSKSMERTYKRLSSKEVRSAFVDAELNNAIALQIKTLRKSRGLTQADLAKLLGTSQNSVSRLEDPSYGRVSIKTLKSLADVFDVGIYLRFMAFSDLLVNTWDTSPDRFLADPYEKDSKTVHFYIDAPSVGVTLFSLPSESSSPVSRLLSDVVEGGFFTNNNSFLREVSGAESNSARMSSFYFKNS